MNRYPYMQWAINYFIQILLVKEQIKKNVKTKIFYFNYESPNNMLRNEVCSCVKIFC